MQGTKAQPRRPYSAGGGQTLFERFEVLEELGSGGFGRVVRCRDGDSGEEIALKELHRFGADALLHFKKEFRSLSDVQHPNLVRLGELLERQGSWAFTLEYVPGTDVLSWVRGSNEDHGFDEARLRDSLVQLVHGLMGLHTLGMLHRDVKPHNVRVTPEGRVVLLDFGLVMHLTQGAQTSAGSALGTVAYMAPEQALHERLGPSADWYALGVLLYELLAGQVPFQGTAFNVMLAKQSDLPPLPSSLAKGIPSDLETLCMGLLATKPHDRLDGEAVLSALAKSSGISVTPPTFQTRGDEPFVGRTAELYGLQARFEQAMKHGIQLALLAGESGIGKSALMEELVAGLAAKDPKTLVLRGRCHAAEQLGYKAFDGAVDELSRHLKLLSLEACSTLLPQDAHLLPVLFPVLSRVPAVARAQALHKVERVERYPLFAAFTELLMRLGKVRSVVLAIDDLQWADQASLVLLKTLLDHSEAPRLLIVGTVRRLEGLDDPVGEGLRALAKHERASLTLVGPLSETETRLLAARLTGDRENGHIAKLLVSESGGHPLFMTELVRHAESLGKGEAVVVDLDAAIMQRVTSLPPAARLMLELLCVASGPVPHAVLRDVLASSPDAAQPVLAMLRAQKLIRTAKRGEIVSYHDRMRQVVLAAIDARTLASHHRKLALSWQTQANVEPARVAQHWLACGEHERAMPWIEQAAQQAEQGGAFERAAEHLRKLLALEGAALSSELKHAFKLRLSEALVAAGRCAESARELLDALEGASAHDAPDLAIRAAQRLLQAGRVEEGLGAARKALELLGMGWPGTPARVVLRLLYNRAAIGLTSFDVQAAPEELITAQQQLELDALRRLSLPMVWADFLRDAEIVSRHTLLALRTRDPAHLAYALSTEAGMRAIQHEGPEQIKGLLAKATSWQKKVGGAELEAHSAYMRGTAAIFTGQFGEAERLLEAADILYRTQCPGAVWELTNVRGVLLGVWHTRGRFAQHAKRAQAWIDEAVARGDAFARATYLVAGHGSLSRLMRDAPAAARAEIGDAMVPWVSDSVGVQHVMETIAVGWVLAYQAGEHSAAYWQGAWLRLSRSFLFRMPFMRDMLLTSRLLSALARACAGDDSKDTQTEIRKIARTMQGQRSAAGRSLGTLALAQVAWLQGSPAQAAALARQARAESESMGTWFARLATLLLSRAENQDDAHDREQQLLAWLASEGWLRPDKALRWLLPVASTWR